MSRNIFQGELLCPDGEIRAGTVVVKDGLIEALLGPEAEVAEAELIRAPQGGVIAPGLIEMQLNGAFGHDFTLEPESIPEVARGLPQHGVTAFLPTLITAPMERYQAAMEAVAYSQGLERGKAGERGIGERGERGIGDRGEERGETGERGKESREGRGERGSERGEWILDSRGAVALGLHLEGPFLSPERPGAHPPGDLRTPEIPAGGGEIEAWIDPRWVRLVTLAPELPGALELIAALVRRGITVGLGHSNATYFETELGVEAGARWTTHLFSAMRPLHHREPGIVGAALADRRVRVALIPDGIHVHPALLNLVAELKGADGVTLISDGMAAAGMAPGSYHIAGQEVTVDATSARLVNGTLAGSVILLDDAVRGMVRLAGRPLAEALRMSSQTPARVLGLDDRGRLAPGCRADLVAFGPDLQVDWTVTGGELAYRREIR